MAKSLFYRFLFIGKMPEHYKSELSGENLIILEEGLKLTVTFRNYKSPGKNFRLKKYWGTGAIGISRNQIIVTYFNSKMLKVRFDDPRFKKIQKIFDKRNLFLKINAHDFNEKTSGEIEIKLVPDNIQKIKDLKIL
jgi:hypothetical protein